MSHKLRRRGHYVSSRLLLLTFGILFSFTFAELALRAANYSFPEFYTPDQSRGYALLPGAEGWYRIEGASYVRINSDGLRDREHSLTKPQNTVRIALIGDSYAEAFQVAMEQSFWAVMEGQLRECDAFGGKNVELINFGVSGYGTAQELITLREKVWKYDPDIVMLAVTTANDITDNARALKHSDQIPYFVYRNNQLIIDDSYTSGRSSGWNQFTTSGAGRWFRINSRVVQALVQGQRGWKVVLASQLPNKQMQSPQFSRAAPQIDELMRQANELGTDNLVYLEPANAVWNDAWRVTEGLIVAMRDEVRRHDAKFVVVTLSNGPQVLPTETARENFKKRFGITDLFYPDNRIKALGLHKEISVITLGPELQEFAQLHQTYLHGVGDNIGNGHWNEVGHRTAGTILAKKLCADSSFK